MNAESHGIYDIKTSAVLDEWLTRIVIARSHAKIYMVLGIKVVCTSEVFSTESVNIMTLIVQVRGACLPELQMIAMVDLLPERSVDRCEILNGRIDR
jgi:hypothetical protein